MAENEALKRVAQQVGSVSIAETSGAARLLIGPVHYHKDCPCESAVAFAITAPASSNRLAGVVQLSLDQLAEVRDHLNRILEVAGGHGHH